MMKTRKVNPLLLLVPLLAALGQMPVAAHADAAFDTASREGFDWQPAARIVIDKSERSLSIVYRDGVLRKFPVSLGGDPLGHKLRQGDSRTPEGRYYIDFKNLDSDFYLSVRISYPNEQDRKLARSLGEDPGGNIMIHGMPNDAAWPYSGYSGQDWTDGCIAVTNQAMQEIWLAVRTDTPVDILP